MFIGRKKELSKLNNLLSRDIANLVVIKGRRRIGKSRLIREFSNQFITYEFMGLPPNEHTTAQMQRDEFAKQLLSYFPISIDNTDDWGDLFRVLAKHTNKGRVVIVFDEISWMANDDPNFLGKLKTVWDLHFSKNMQLILILCGSVSSWIEKNILSNTGYLGRPTLHMTLNELPLSDCDQFWKNRENISDFEKLKILSVTGGVPRYLELIDPSISAEDNIRNLCFTTDSPLYDEFKYIFSDIYGKRSEKYQAIVSLLSRSKSTREDIIRAIGLPHGGETTQYLEELAVGGFIAQDHTWSIKNKKISSLSYYRLKDNYTRFYLKYVLPNKAKIEQGSFENVSISNLPGWNSILALQFENLVINNQNNIFTKLGIQPEDIIIANPFFQRATTRQSGCQIDFMIQTRHDTLYICEIKFSRNPIPIDVISEVKTKIKLLKLPKNISKRAVLIHVNDVKDEVVDEVYFSKIIDFGSFLVKN